MSEVNEEQRAYWNLQGHRWVKFQEELDRLIRPLGREILGVLKPLPGERVLDVGCGCGDSTLDAARRVSPGGSVLGIDISEPVLVRARERADAEGLSNVRFEHADAQVRRFEPGSFEAVTSRFGVMFFEDPPGAFANLRSALVPGGRLGFVCWQALDRNPWVAISLGAVAKIVGPPEPPEPGAPGPFSFADPERVRSVLSFAGFADVELAGCERRLVLGADVESAASFACQAGPASRLLRDVDDAQRERALEAVREALGPHLGPRGVELPCAAWLVTASNPA